jgi:hypothetical protein
MRGMNLFLNLWLAALASHQPIGGSRMVAAPGPHQDDFGFTIPPGTEIPATLDENVTVKQDQIGNTFPAHVTRDVMVGGAIAIPRDAPAKVALVESEDNPGAASFRLVSVSINGRMRPVRTGLAQTDAARSGMSTGKKTGIGAIAGGALGLIAGGGSGLLKGAVIGAGGGLAWGLLDHGSHRVGQGTPLQFSLRDAVRVG